MKRVARILVAIAVVLWMIAGRMRGRDAPAASPRDRSAESVTPHGAGR